MEGVFVIVVLIPTRFLWRVVGDPDSPGVLVERDGSISGYIYDKCYRYISLQQSAVTMTRVVEWRYISPKYFSQIPAGE